MKVTRAIHPRVWIVVALVTLARLLSANNSSYQQSVEKWRHDYENYLTADDGWLTVSGLFWLHEGENRFGSDPLSDITLPAASAPASAGYFEYRGAKVVVHLNPGVKATLNGNPIQEAELHPYLRPHQNAGVQATMNATPKEAESRPDSADERVVMGDLTLYVHASGNRFAIRVKDKNNKRRRNYAGSQWFPIDESYRFTARYNPYDSPKQLETQNVLGDPEKVSVVGYVTFSLRGQEYRLDAEALGSGGLFFVFRDLTSGKQTYPAARFLASQAPKEGRVEVDFNKAYNPPCAYNPYTTCPLPLPGNRLRVEIPAGEKIYQHEH